MKHPNDAELALHAGSDLGWLKQWITARHVRNCGACQAVVVEFSQLRPGAKEFPQVPWNRLASEMTANIRLGIEAGECVSLKGSTARDWLKPAVATKAIFGAGTRIFAWPQLALACLFLLTVGGVGYLMRHSSPGVTGNAAPAGPVLEASESGLQVREAGQTLRLLNTSGSSVSRSVGSRGELGARYLDSNGYVTISQVYGQ